MRRCHLDARETDDLRTRKENYFGGIINFRFGCVDRFTSEKLDPPILHFPNNV
jgi:hypothetical protein